MRAPCRTIALALFLLAALPAFALAQESGTDVVGGESTTSAEWPWQVALASPPSAGGDGFDRQFCGGSLLSATAVLTAAHCVYDEATGTFIGPGELTVITGRTKLSSSEGAEIGVSDVIYFVQRRGAPAPQSQQLPTSEPQLYDPDSDEWDVAVVELAGPAPPPAAPVALADPVERAIWEPGDPVFATGWGDTLDPLEDRDSLREVELDVIADEDCGDLDSYGSGFRPATMVCAGVEGGGKDTCQGDSGGPLVAPIGGGFRQVGVTSVGFGCALPEKYGIYARVADATMRGAILEGVRRANGDPAPADTRAPETKLRGHPRKGTTKRRARFTWGATEAASFACSLDGGRPKPCSSPWVKRVRIGRRHTFTIRATDEIGNVEPRPASFRWKVRRRR